MNEEGTAGKHENLDELLSMRGKPFANWKEERKYLREKWGMQGQEIFLKSNQEEPEESEDQESLEAS